MPTKSRILIRSNNLKNKKKMIVIKSQCGAIFQGMDEDFMDAEMELNIAYYKAQGCIVEKVESFEFSKKCKCDYCKKIEHNFDELIEEIKDEY